MTETATETAVETLISVTERAAQEMLSVRAGEPENADKGLRVYVEGGGCSGLQYGMTFDEKRADDTVADYFGLPVYVDSFSANYLKGAVIEFSEALTGGGFKIKNPNAHSSCGCGKSFEA